MSANASTATAMRSPAKPWTTVWTAGPTTVRSYSLETLRFHDDTTRQLIGTYDDELRRVDGVWRFSTRRYRVLIDNI